MTPQTDSTSAIDTLVTAFTERVAMGCPDPDASDSSWMDYLVAVGVVVDATARRHHDALSEAGESDRRASTRSEAAAAAFLGELLLEIELPSAPSPEVANTLAALHAEYSGATRDERAAAFAVRSAGWALENTGDDTIARASAETVCAAAPLLDGSAREALRPVLRAAERRLHGPNAVETILAELGESLEWWRSAAKTVTTAVSEMRSAAKTVTTEVSEIWRVVGEQGFVRAYCPTAGLGSPAVGSRRPAWVIHLRSESDPGNLEIELSASPHDESDAALQVRMTHGANGDPLEELPVRVILEVGVVGEEQTQHVTIDDVLLCESRDGTTSQLVLTVKRPTDDLGVAFPPALLDGMCFARLASISVGEGA